MSKPNLTLYTASYPNLTLNCTLASYPTKLYTVQCTLYHIQSQPDSLYTVSYLNQIYTLYTSIISEPNLDTIHLYHVKPNLTLYTGIISKPNLDTVHLYHIQTQPYTIHWYHIETKRWCIFGPTPIRPTGILPIRPTSTWFYSC